MTSFNVNVDQRVKLNELSLVSFCKFKLSIEIYFA